MNKVLSETKLQIEILVPAVDKDGDAIEVAKIITYPRVVESISDEDLHLVGEAIGSLQHFPVQRVYRVDQNALA